MVGHQPRTTRLQTPIGAACASRPNDSAFIPAVAYDLQVSSDKFHATRIRVLRRVAYGLNTLALREGRVPAEGPFDAAAANGLAAIIAHEHPGAERSKDGQISSPNQLLGYVRQQRDTEPWAQSINVELLEEGVRWSQPFRHGRADDEWTRVSGSHIAALVGLDEHPALQVLSYLQGKTFDEAVVHAYADEATEQLPFDPKDRSGTPPPTECSECWRETVISQDWDAWGIYAGEGACIACGYERTYEDTVDDFMRWRED